MIGTKLAHYENHVAPGFRRHGRRVSARDSKLGRSVAVKFLPDKLCSHWLSPRMRIAFSIATRPVPTVSSFLF